MSFYTKTYPDILLEKDEHLLWLTLNNEKSSNAITDDMIDSLEEVVALADADNDIRVLIITGAGKNFCSGGDVDAMEKKSGMFAGESFELGNKYKQGIQRIPRALESFQKPIIAMVNGAAIGAGCDLACMCDMRVASDKAKFGETFAKLGLVPGDGGTFFLQRVVGYAKAMEMILTADIYDSTAALGMGLVNQVHSFLDLKEKTRELAIKIANIGPVGLALTKRALKMGRTHDLNSQLEVLSMYQGIAQRTQDHFEGLSAMKEKRSPEFKGR